MHVEQLAQEFDRFFRDYYQPGEEEWYYEADSDGSSFRQRGEHYEDIIASELGCTQEVVSAVAENLPDADWHEISQGADRFYSDQNYERISDAEKRQKDEQEAHWYEFRFNYQWEDFCEIVKYERRFFRIKELLDDLFGSPSEYETGPIRPVYLLPPRTKLYRARLLTHDLTEKAIEANPAQLLSAPPKDKARSGRMNVEFIPAFYAAFSEQTAVAEIRPTIGDFVAVGEFVSARPLKAFDFSAFSRPGVDWKTAYEHTRYDFITQMENEISKPISPFARQLEYIGTQVVAEYLREFFECDAVVYKSSLIKHTKADDRNIVLLNRGAEFVGTDPEKNSLRYSSFEIKYIDDVQYSFSSMSF